MSFGLHFLWVVTMTVSDFFLKKMLSNMTNFNKAFWTNSRFTLSKTPIPVMKVEITLCCTTQDIQRDVKYYVSTEVLEEVNH